MYAISDEILEFYKGINPTTGYIYYFLNDNLKIIQRDQLKIGVGFYRSNWIDGSFLFECDSYMLKSLKDFLAGQYLWKGGFNVWGEWTHYHARLWAAVGICRLMGTGSFYLTGHGPTMILRKKLEDIPAHIAMTDAVDSGSQPSDIGYLVYRDPGGGAHLRNWKLFYVVLSEILGRAGIENLEEDIIQAMSGNEPETRFVIRADEEIYGFPSLYKVEQVSDEELKEIAATTGQAVLNDWLLTEAQFDAGGFTEEFKAYYKFMMDHYTRDDEYPHILSLLEHGISWFLQCIPANFRPAYRQRYYDLVERFAKSDDDKKMTMNWLDSFTGSSIKR